MKNVDNERYDGGTRLEGVAESNGLYCPVDVLREVVRPICEEHDLDETDAIPDDSKLTVGDAMKSAAQMRLQKS